MEIDNDPPPLDRSAHNFIQINNGFSHNSIRFALPTSVSHGILDAPVNEGLYKLDPMQKLPAQMQTFLQLMPVDPEPFEPREAILPCFRQKEHEYAITALRYQSGVDIAEDYINLLVTNPLSWPRQEFLDWFYNGFAANLNLNPALRLPSREEMVQSLENQRNQRAVHNFIIRIIEQDRKDNIDQPNDVPAQNDDVNLDPQAVQENLQADGTVWINGRQYIIKRILPAEDEEDEEGDDGENEEGVEDAQPEEDDASWDGDALGAFVKPQREAVHPELHVEPVQVLPFGGRPISPDRGCEDELLEYQKLSDNNDVNDALKSMNECFTCIICRKLKGKFVLCIAGEHYSCCSECIMQLKEKNKDTLENFKCPVCRAPFDLGSGDDFAIVKDMKETVQLLKKALKNHE